MASADVDVGLLTQVISSGGVTALAVLVYVELRAMRPIMRAVEKALAALLERDRMRTGPHPLVRLPDDSE